MAVQVIRKDLRRPSTPYCLTLGLCASRKPRQDSHQQPGERVQVSPNGHTEHLSKDWETYWFWSFKKIRTIIS